MSPPRARRVPLPVTPCAGVRRCPIGQAASCATGGRCPMTSRAVAAGVTLAIEGAPANRVYYVLDGSVALLREAGDRHGAGVPWTVRRDGSLLGAEALVQDPYCDTAVTLTDTTVCVAERDALKGWVDEVGVAAARALMELAIRAHVDDGPRPSSAEGTAVQRVACWLADEGRGGVAPAIPRAMAAGLLGMLPETFSRALAALSSRGVITVSRKEIRVIDARRLLALAESSARG